jgi:hypothetical protein
MPSLSPQEAPSFKRARNRRRVESFAKLCPEKFRLNQVLCSGISLSEPSRAVCHAPDF